MFGWTAAQIPLLVSLPILLIASGFFSGSETALFGLSHSERMSLRRRNSLAVRAIDALLHEPRMLLITVLLGNMVVNVLYFVISSVLILHAAEATILIRIGIGAATLLLIVLFGEVIPKLVANSGRMTFASLTAPPLLALHRALLPLRRLVDVAIVAPLSRLTAPSTPPPALDRVELTSLLEQFGERGVIDETERRVLEDVINLGRLRVDHVMTPRVRVRALPLDATREDVIAAARETRFTKFPVIDGDLDHIVGILHVKRFLLDRDARSIAGSKAVTRPRYIPEIATLDHLLEDFRRTRTQVAIAVDEYGGTAGIVAVEDIVREIVGELREAASETAGAIESLSPGRWRVAGDVDMRDLEQVVFGERSSDEPASLGALITRELGRPAEVGDVAHVGSMLCEVAAVEGTRVTAAVVTVSGSSEPTQPADHDQPDEDHERNGGGDSS